MKIKLVISCLAIFMALNLSAQEEQTIFNSPSVRFSGVWVSLDRNFSHFDDEFYRASGFSVSAEISRDFLIGYVRQEFDQSPRVGDQAQRLNLEYDGLLLGYAPNSYRVLHPRINVAAGSGRARLNNGEYDRVFVVQPSLGLELNATEWCRIGVDGGYRFVTDDDLGIKTSDLDSYFIQASLRFGFSWND